jgi:hypothetical protein
LPGHNYIGPSTPILTNLLNGVPPVDEIDRVAIRHDIDYIRANGDIDKLTQADFRAIKAANKLSLDGVLLTTGLSMRTGLSYLSLGYISFGGVVIDPEEAELLSNYMMSKYRKINVHK